MGSRFMRHGHRDSLADSDRTGRRRFSAKVIFSTLVSYRSQKCQVVKVTPQTPTLQYSSLSIRCEKGLKRAAGQKMAEKNENGFALYALITNY